MTHVWGSGTSWFPAAAKIHNLRTSAPVTKCGPSCAFNKNDCPALTGKVTWKGLNGARIIFGGVNSLIVRLSINKKKIPFDIRKVKYTAFMLFSKSKCGMNFLKAATDGTVKMSLMDKSPVLGLGTSLAEWSDAQMYEQNFSHLRIGAKASATIQFRQKVAPKSPPKDLPVGKTTMDQIYLTISGLDGVVGGIANMGTCFDKGGILLGVMKDLDAGRGDKDWSRCVGEKKNIK